MSFSQYAGLAIVPTLARLVLAAAFTAAGYHKVFKDADFTAAEADRLRELGVEVSGPASEAQASVLRGGQGPAPAGSRLAAFRQTQPDQSNPMAEEPAVSGNSPAEPPSLDPLPPSSPAGAAPIQTLPEPKPYKATGLHNVTLLVDKAGWSNAKWMGMLAAGTELVGGAMLLIGLFSRVWGLGLAFAMGVAMHLTSAIPYWNLFPLEIGQADHRELFQMFFLQASLLVLAFGVFLTGPGPLSVDRLLFGGPKTVSGAVAVPVKSKLD